MGAFAQLKTGERAAWLVFPWEAMAPSNMGSNIQSSSHLLVRSVAHWIPRRERTITRDLPGTFSVRPLTPFSVPETAKPGRPTTSIKSRAALVLHKLPHFLIFILTVVWKTVFSQPIGNLPISCLAKKIPHQYRQLPGEHSWAYWDQQVREVLRLYAQLMTSNVPGRRLSDLPQRLQHRSLTCDSNTIHDNTLTATDGSKSRSCVICNAACPKKFVDRSQRRVLFTTLSRALTKC